MSWLTDTLLVTGALIALVLALRAPVARLFGPGMAYALWALPVLRLLVPPVILPAPAAPVETLNAMPTVVTVLADPVPALAAPPAPVWAYAPLLQTVWLAGALAYLGWRVWQYIAMRRSLMQGAVSVGESGKIRLIECPAAVSPVAFGLRDKVIALPPGFMALTPRRERDLAIAHELEHHRGRDLAINVAVQPLLALHWFNPIAWLGWKALRRDQEAACDARVLAGREPETREAYGRLIAAFASSRSPALASPLACPIIIEKSIIHRLRSLTMTQPSQTRRRAGHLLIGAAALALPLTATITYAASEPEQPAQPKAPAKAEPNVTHGIVIIDNPDGSTIDDKTLHTRTVQRNGKTIVLKTKTPLTDAEAEERIAKAEASAKEADAMVWTSSDGKHGKTHKSSTVVMVRHSGVVPPHAPEAPVPPEPPVPPEASRRDGADNAPKVTYHKSEASIACPEGRPVLGRFSRGTAGQEQQSAVIVCVHVGAKTVALPSLRKTRANVAANPDIPAEAKADVLRQLDAEIEKLEKLTSANLDPNHRHGPKRCPSRSA